jgi:hypothetical protein
MQIGIREEGDLLVVQEQSNLRATAGLKALGAQQDESVEKNNKRWSAATPNPYMKASYMTEPPNMVELVAPSSHGPGWRQCCSARHPEIL